jgi:hypothetical protein
MKLRVNKIPRVFSPLKDIFLKDMGEIELGDNEQLTFKTKSGKTNDIVKKEWGFYLSNSLNCNFKKKGFKTALVVSCSSVPQTLFINLVEKEKLDKFNKYLDRFNCKVLCWLDEWNLEKDKRVSE